MEPIHGSRFLDLPAELRNRIYEIAARGSPSFGQEYRPIIHNSRGSRKASHIHDDKGFLGLTQACRQVRDEFRPSYLAHRRTYIRFFDVVHFLECMFDSMSRGPPVVPLDLAVDMRHVGMREHQDDLAPALRALLTHHDLRHSLFRDDCCQRATRRIFVGNVAAWRHALNNDIDQVIASDSGLWMGIDIVFKSTSKLPCLIDCSETLRPFPPHVLRRHDYFVRLGLCNDEFLGVAVAQRPLLENQLQRN
ncbi:hypothetical protein BKA63DRAFT_501662 [Paraphoma chrysanthemicola]|nr:hypothetical protein BKA63DRAFT_501662 [Paraphoma chrysanthemicola]